MFGLMQNGTTRQANLKMLFERAKKYESASFKGLFNFINFIDKLKLSSGDLGAAKIIGENEDTIRIMSIHKSKGLEFPVVFLCGTGKKFNMQDLNENIILHQDIGIGPKYINHERQIEYNTLAKEAIKIQTKKEILSEEMRVLYVALTRSKEKLIITGISKDVDNDINDKTETLKQYIDNYNSIETNDNRYINKINPSVVSKYKSYLDWLELIYLNNKMENNKKNKNDEETKKNNIGSIEDTIELKIHSKEEVLKYINIGTVEERKELTDIIKEYTDITEINELEDKCSDNNEKHKSNMSKINDILNWQYKYSFNTKLQSKLSVTNIKELEEDQKESNDSINNNVKESIDIEKLEYKSKDDLYNIDNDKYKENIIKTPKFLNNKKEISNAEKGTIIHLCIQNLNINEDYTVDSIKEMINKMISIDMITKKEADSIHINKLYNFTNSYIWKQMKDAKLLEREKPFYINTPIEDIWEVEYKEEKEEADKENILVQGIIDTYYINDKDELILVDYKTDYVPNKNENILIEKYKTQLNLYKKALEEALNRKVSKTYIYSVYLDKEIEMVD